MPRSAGRRTTAHARTDWRGRPWTTTWPTPTTLRKPISSCIASIGRRGRSKSCCARGSRNGDAAGAPIRVLCTCPVSSEPSSFLPRIGKRRPLSALARRREVEHGPAAERRLAAQPGVGIHGARLAHGLEEGQVTGVVRVAAALVETDTELARDGARPVHLSLVDAERLAEPAGQHAVLHLGLDGGPPGRAERPRDRGNEEVHPA